MAISLFSNKNVDLVTVSGEKIGDFNDTSVSNLPAKDVDFHISAEWDEGREPVTVLLGLEKALRKDHASADRGYEIYQSLISGARKS